MPYREDPLFWPTVNKGYGAIAAHILERFKQEPVRYGSWWILGKPRLFWSWKLFFSDGINIYPVGKVWFDINPVMKFLKTIMVRMHPVFVFLAGAGILIFFRKQSHPLSDERRFVYLLCLGTLAYFTLLFMVLAPFPRYALPLGPFLYILTSYSASSMVQFVVEKKRAKKNAQGS